MIFSYVALNKGNKKVEGNMPADDISSARKKLHEMGFSVLSIEEKKEEAGEKVVEKDYFSYEFKAVDQKGKEIVGTIDAVNALKAYTRLVDEFHFEVEYLFDLDANNLEQEQQKEGLVADLKSQYQMSASPRSETQEKTQKEEDLSINEQVGFTKINVLRNQIDIMIVTIKGLLKKIEGEESKKSKILVIKNLLNELERVKMSNNLSNTRSLADRILSAAEDLFKGEDDYQVVVKQKQSLKNTDNDKMQQFYYQNAVELEGFTGALKKASRLLQKYINNLGIKIPGVNNLDASNLLNITEKKPVFDSTLEDVAVKVYQVAELLGESKSALKEKVKRELKALFNFKSKTNQERKLAWLNLKTLLQVYLKSNQDEKSKWWSFSMSYNQEKSDYENVFREVDIFLSWLLCFYIVFYYLGGMVLQKNLNFLSGFMYKTVTVDFLLYFVFFIFVSSLLIKLKIKFFRQSFFGGVFVLLINVFLVMFYVLNY